MSQNTQKLYEYLQASDPNPEQFGDFQLFSENLQDPSKAEKLRLYLDNEQFGDSTMFYDKINEDAVNKPDTLPLDSNITATTVNDSSQILMNEMNEPGSSQQTLSTIINEDFDSSQKIHSTDSGFFQINDKTWNNTAMSMFGKSVADLNVKENIALASHIQKNDPRGMNNWVSYNNQKHKDFDGITDDDIVNKYGVQPDVLDLINQSFDDPQTAKQVMLAESGGDSSAVNVNYTPQEDGKETVDPGTLQQSEQLINKLQNFQPQFETAEPSSSGVMTQMERQDFPVFGLTGTQIAPFLQEKSEKLLKAATSLDSPMWNTREFENLKPVVELGVNALSHLAELPGLVIDIPTSLVATPEEAVIGLLKFIPEEFNNLAIATNTVDVLNPILGLAGQDFSREELNQMRAKAQKHIYDSGGVYTYFAATGLTHMGKKNAKIIEKNKEFSDIVDVANGKQPVGKVTPEMQKAVDALKENIELKEKAEIAKNNQLLTDYLEKWEVENKVEKAEIAAEQLELKLDVKPPAKKPTPSKPLSKLQARKKETQRLKAEAKKKKAQKTKSTEVNLERDIPSPSVVKNKIKKDVKKVQKKVETIKKEVSVKKKNQKTVKSAPSELVQEIKLEKSSDLNIGKGIEAIKGESARRYKSQEKVDAYIEQKLSEYVGQNIIARYGKTAKGDYLVKIFKKTKEQPLPRTATKRTGAKIEKETSAEIVGKMRDPRDSKRRIQDEDILIEKYESQISELGRSTDASLRELVKLEIQALETGVQSPRAKLLKNSIDATNRLIEKTQIEVQGLKTTRELMKDIVKNVARRKAKGAVGRDVKQSVKERLENEKMNRELARDINIIWERGNTSVKKTKTALISYLKENGAPKELINHVNKNFKQLYDETTIQNMKILANEINAELPQSQGEVRGSRTATRTREEYLDNMRIDIPSGKEPNQTKLSVVNLLDVITQNIGAEKSAKAKGTRTFEEIRRGSKEANLLAEVVHEVESGKYATLRLSEKRDAVLNIVGTLAEEFGRTRNPEVRDLLYRYILASKSYISEPARATGSLRDFAIETIRDWKEYEYLFPDDPKMLDILRDVYTRKEVKRSRLFKLAEYGRNMKLATGSSLVRSLAGNAMATTDAYARMPFEFGADYLIRKTSGALYELTNGYYGNLSPNQMHRLELGAQFSGYHRGFRKTGDLLYDMFMENDAALRESPFFRREGFTYKDIKGKKGVVIRTPQRFQGMIDIMYRVPMTNGYMHRYAVRQAIKDGYKTQAEILQRANEIIETKSLDSKFLENAIRDGEYVTFQRELGAIGQWVNKLRTGNTVMSAGAQMLVPFFNTAGNLFKYTLEHTPLNVFTSNFRKGLVEAFSREGAGSRRLATEVGKMSTGLGTMYLLNEFLVENAAGNITGDWSDMSPEERNMRTVDGQQEYSVKLGDGSVVSFRGFEPVSSYLTLIEALQRTEEDAYSSDENIEKYGNMVFNATKELGKSFLENPFLAGTGDLFKAMHGRKDWLDFSFNFLSGMAVPGTYRQWLSVVDPVRKRRFKLADYDENTNYIDILESQAENILPWYLDAENLDALDPFGTPIPKPDPKGGLLAWRRTQPVNDPVYAEIQKIYFDQGEGFKPASAFFTSSDLAKIKLTPAEHHALIQASGKDLYDFIQKAMQTDLYNELTPAVKRNMINKIKEKYVTVHRAAMFSKDLAVPAGIMKAKELTGEFKTPEDREKFLRQERSAIPAQTVNEILQQYTQ